MLLDEAFLRETFGVRLRPGSVFTGNVYKYAAGEACVPGRRSPLRRERGCPAAQALENL